jgi:hypothetical protein
MVTKMARSSQAHHAVGSPLWQYDALVTSYDGLKIAGFMGQLHWHPYPVWVPCLAAGARAARSAGLERSFKPKQPCSLLPGPHQHTELQTLGLLWLGAAGSMIMRGLGSVSGSSWHGPCRRQCRLCNVAAANADSMDHHQYMHTAHGDAWWPGPIFLHACNSVNSWS